MIALDSSAIVAILLSEPDKKQLHTLWAVAERSVVAAPTVLECFLVLSYDKTKSAALSELIERMGAEIIPFDEHLLAAAMQAHQKYGKGRHKAKLNLGDCMSYALAKFHGIPLLCKGEDFRHTDVTIAA